jgi:phosphoribosylanthranilate isomerase
VPGAQSRSKTLRSIDILGAAPTGASTFEANAFLHHMIRNIMGCLVAVGQGLRPPNGWPRCWLRPPRGGRAHLSPDGLYFLGPVYAPEWGLPDRVPGFDWLAIIQGMPHRTRIKICGLTREADVDHAVQAGADAIGFVLYPPSPALRHPSDRAGRTGPPAAALRHAGAAVRQRHSPRTGAGLAAVPNACCSSMATKRPPTAKPRAALPARRRVPGRPAQLASILLKYAQARRTPRPFLLDAHVQGYGGGGQSFDWTAFHWSHPLLNASSRLVLSGGLTPANVTDGIRLVRPWAVDVSSGVESAKGIKEPRPDRPLRAAVRAADAAIPLTAPHELTCPIGAQPAAGPDLLKTPCTTTNNPMPAAISAFTAAASSAKR